MAVEIERKFLIDKQKFKKIRKTGEKITQGYLSSDPSVRIRVKGELGFITIKGKRNGISRLEFEYKIPSKDAVEILNKLCNKTISKIRYIIKYKNQDFEVDEFLDENEGLFLAELELVNKNQHIDLPDWITTDVSDDNRYYNSNLLKNPYKYWKDKPY